VDDVLRRVFDVPVGGRKSPENPDGRSDSVKRRHSGKRGSFATVRMHAAATEGQLNVSFADGTSREWHLPSKDDKAGIRRVRDSAVEFARQHRATIGQQNAVKKALTEAGYYVSR
jgi:hypothetical protein